MERFDIDRPQLVSQAPARPIPAETNHASAPTQADIASEALPPLGRASIAEGSHGAACVPSEDRASYSALASEGRAPAPALPLESSIHAWAMACGRGGGMMAEGVEGLQAVLQDNSSALQQELRTAEAKMEVCNKMPSVISLSCIVLIVRCLYSWHIAHMRVSHGMLSVSHGMLHNICSQSMLHNTCSHGMLHSTCSHGMLCTWTYELCTPAASLSCSVACTLKPFICT